MGAHNRTEMLRLQGVLLTILRSTSRIESEAALNPSLVQKKVQPQCSRVPAMCRRLRGTLSQASDRRRWG